MKQEEIEWKLFELAEGELQGEELKFWENKINTDPKIKEHFEWLSQTYLTQQSQKHPSQSLVEHPLHFWGENIAFNKESLKKTAQQSNWKITRRNPVSIVEIDKYQKQLAIAASLVIFGLMLWGNREKLFYNTSLPQEVISSQKNETPKNIETRENDMPVSFQKNSHATKNKKADANSLLATSPESNSLTPLQTKSDNSMIHPLIAATENYLSKPDNTVTESKSNTISIANSIADNISAAPVVEETIITVVHHQPQTNQEKRKLVAFKVKEMMRNGQLPNVKIQPSPSDRPGIIPAFQVQLNIDNTPVFQTSNR